MTNKNNSIKECCKLCWQEYLEDIETGDLTLISKPFCCNDSCPCHTQAPQNNYERHSHYHCWEQVDNEDSDIEPNKTPACGQPLESHKQCCLCDVKFPEDQKMEDCQVCGNYICKCEVKPFLPQKKDTSWEERFDEEFEYKSGLSAYYHRDIIKDFISKEIQKAEERHNLDCTREEWVRQQTLSSVIEEIEKMKKTTAIAKPGILEDQIDELNLKLRYDSGYNQALEDLKTLLKQKIN